ncbi:group III truncated hemoglobin [Pseudopedobacter beijingensis]|uniref:Group III truncated hemoglobin n=1 Tax=Pseudopedobacter beijingensis TaxID=1207056 RepID=A0ABW4IBW8_9SPHI
MNKNSVIYKDIKNKEDITELVLCFYNKIREDELLSPIFNAVIKDWDSHLEKMISFWFTLLLYTRTYKGDPLPVHLPLKIEKTHFDRWINLFETTIDERFKGEIATNAKKRAWSIARIMKAVKQIPEE